MRCEEDEEMRSVDEAVEIPFYIPPMDDGKSHHVISWGQRPKFYRPQDLRDKGIGKTAWVDAFEKILVGLHWALDGPVPYAFKTPDGQIRSLDAGCIKMLMNRKTPALILNCDPEGYISSVVPIQVMLDRYAPLRARLVARVVDARPGSTGRGRQ